MVLKLVAFLLVSILFACSNEPDKKNTIPQETSAQKSANLFILYCASCHGEDGKKGLAGAADLSTSLDQLTISNAILNGKGNMPPMPNISSDTTNLNAVIKYVQTLKK